MRLRTTQAQYKLCFMALLAAKSNKYRVRREGKPVAVPQPAATERRGSGGASSADSLLAQLSIRDARLRAVHNTAEPEYGNVAHPPAGMRGRMWVDILGEENKNGQELFRKSDLWARARQEKQFRGTNKSVRLLIGSGIHPYVALYLFLSAHIVRCLLHPMP